MLLRLDAWSGFLRTDFILLDEVRRSAVLPSAPHPAQSPEIPLDKFFEEVCKLSCGKSCCCFFVNLWFTLIALFKWLDAIARPYFVISLGYLFIIVHLASEDNQLGGHWLNWLGYALTIYSIYVTPVLTGGKVQGTIFKWRLLPMICCWLTDITLVAAVSIESWPYIRSTLDNITLVHNISITNVTTNGTNCSWLNGTNCITSEPSDSEDRDHADMSATLLFSFVGLTLIPFFSLLICIYRIVKLILVFFLAWGYSCTKSAFRCCCAWLDRR